MKYKSAYIIVMSISVVLIFGTTLGIYKIANKVWLVSTLEKVEGKIISCKSNYFKRTIKSGSGGQQLKYAPVARIDGGIEVSGSVYSSRESCNKTIHEIVTVLVDKNAENGGYIITFSQFWLGPIVLIAGTLIANLLFVYPMAIVTKKL